MVIQFCDTENMAKSSKYISKNSWIYTKKTHKLSFYFLKKIDRRTNKIHPQKKSTNFWNPFANPLLRLFFLNPYSYKESHYPLLWLIR
jgi:hypothetical protein